MSEITLDRPTCETWLDTLMSGKYTQCRGRFLSQDGKRHCCMAVLQEVRGRNVHDYNDGFKDPNDCYPSDVLPFNVRQDLIRMNDSDKSFADIALYVRAAILPHTVDPGVTAESTPAQDGSL